MKEPLLRVIVEIDAYKATRAKTEAYGEKYGKFEGLSTRTNIEGCK